MSVESWLLSIVLTAESAFALLVECADGHFVFKSRSTMRKVL